MPMSRSGCGGRVWPRSRPDLRARWWWWCSSPPTMQRGTGPAGTPRRVQPGGCRGSVCVLPARFDDHELPGLVPDVVAVDPGRYTPAQFADVVVAEVADLAISLAPSGGPGGRGAGGGGRPAAARRRRRQGTCRRPDRYVAGASSHWSGRTSCSRTRRRPSPWSHAQVGLGPGGRRRPGHACGNGTKVPGRRADPF